MLFAVARKKVEIEQGQHESSFWAPLRACRRSASLPERRSSTFSRGKPWRRQPLGRQGQWTQPLPFMTTPTAVSAPGSALEEGESCARGSWPRSLASRVRITWGRGKPPSLPPSVRPSLRLLQSMLSRECVALSTFANSRRLQQPEGGRRSGRKQEVHARLIQKTDAWKSAGARTRCTS
jgi:hypothetical protein